MIHNIIILLLNSEILEKINKHIRIFHYYLNIIIKKNQKN